MKNCEWFADGGYCRKTECSGEPCVEQVAVTICRNVAELPDRNSPEDWPEAMLVTHDELHSIVIAALGVEGLKR